MNSTSIDGSGQSLLVVIDPTADDQPALARAARLAERDGYSLELFICDHDDYLDAEGYAGPTDFSHVRESMMKSRRDQLSNLAEPLAEKGLDVSCDIAWDRPVHEGIVRRVMRGNCAMVFKDTHYHNALRRALFSNTDWNLIRTCPKPLWLVKADTKVDNKTILAAVDPQHSHDKPAALDNCILAAAFKAAGAEADRLQVLHSYNLSYVGVSSDAVTAPVLLEREIRQMHEGGLQKLIESHDIPAERVHLLPGHPVVLIPKLARDLDAGLVVMGAVARSRLQRIFVGSTAERVMDQVPCDLLIAKPDDFVCPVEQRPYQLQDLDTR